MKRGERREREREREKKEERGEKPDERGQRSSDTDDTMFVSTELFATKALSTPPDITPDSRTLELWRGSQNHVDMHVPPLRGSSEFFCRFRSESEGFFHPESHSKLRAKFAANSDSTFRPFLFFFFFFLLPRNHPRGTPPDRTGELFDGNFLPRIFQCLLWCSLT